MKHTGSRLFKKFLDALTSGSFAPGIQKSIWKHWYQLLTRYWRNDDWCFMNYGYLPEAGTPQLHLEERDEKDRCFISLYQHVINGIPVSGQRLLKVGSGRGGGSAYIARYLGPREMVGVDFAATSVALSNRLHSHADILRFVEGDAEALPFDDSAFDVVLNIESSHCYADMSRFVAEVSRVLKPGGYFAWADMRGLEMMSATKRVFTHPELLLIRAENITPGVIRALDAVHDRKLELIRKVWMMRPLLHEFVGARGSLLYNGLKSGKVIYLTRTFQKRQGS